MTSSYEKIMGLGVDDDAAKALGKRLVSFRKWLHDEARATVHPAVCIVNGMATDGTKNAPVLVFDSKADDTNGNEGSKFAGRAGAVDGDSSTTMYDRTMGCQLRSTREIKKDEVIIEIPRPAFVTPDLVAASDAGKAVFSCCQTDDCESFWDAFENTSICVSRVSAIGTSVGPQALVKILQERKKAEGVLNSRLENGAEREPVLATKGTVSTRAPFLAFLIHQRFASSDVVPVSGSFDGDLPEAAMVELPAEVPDTFSPYARTLPSYIPIPLCWKRPELAVLAACLPGYSCLQEVASNTSQLAAEFAALLDAGILERFPDVFPPGLITWDRWVWAAAVFSSRLLPARTYSETFASDSTEKAPFLSPAEVWQETGVLIPLLDMLNHVAGDNHITWKSAGNETPQAVTHRKVKKGSEIFTDYGNMGNGELLVRYGFARINNSADEVRMGWALADAVGNVDVPFDFLPPYKNQGSDVYESNDEVAINAWWTKDRMHLLEKLVYGHPKTTSTFAAVKAGKKLTVTAHGDGAYCPLMLLSAVAATMPIKEVKACLEGGTKSIVVSRNHQRILRRYLEFFFTRKLEKLLQNLNSGLKDHFSDASIWTKASDGGLGFKPKEGGNGGDCIGWYAFFDANAYQSSMEMEGNYYTLANDSCVLALYDGQLRALEASLQGVSDRGKLSERVLKQLEELGHSYSKREESNGYESPDNEGAAIGDTTPIKKRKKEKGLSPSERPPAVKLHVGNLSYTTTPSDLFNYFSSIYGQDNVLECHIPIERDSGRSRGFGFVAMPEAIALKALGENVTHEVGGRILKVARSNSAGSVSANRTPDGPPTIASDRCRACGYRPKYCTCDTPKLPAGAKAQSSKPTSSPGSHSGYSGYEPSSDYKRRDRNYDRYGGSDYYRDDRRRDYYDYDDKDRYRDYDRDRRYRYDDDYRRSYDRGDDDRYNRDSSRSRRDRDGGRREHSSSAHGSSRRWERDEHYRSSPRRERNVDPEDYERGEKRSRSKEKNRRRKRRKNRDRSRSGSKESSYAEK